MDNKIAIPIEKIIKATKDTLRMRFIKQCHVYIPALGKDIAKILNPETVDISFEFTDKDEIICRNSERYEITITKDLPEDYRELAYGKLRKMFHMVKLDLIDDDTIAPSNSETVYLYYKIG